MRLPSIGTSSHAVMSMLAASSPRSTTAPPPSSTAPTAWRDHAAMEIARCHADTTDETSAGMHRIVLVPGPLQEALARFAETFRAAQARFPDVSADAVDAVDAVDDVDAPAATTTLVGFETTPPGIATKTAAKATTKTAAESIAPDQADVPETTTVGAAHAAGKYHVFQWSTLSAHLRTEAALGEAYALLHNVSLPEAVALLRRDDQAFDDAWLAIPRAEAADSIDESTTVSTAPTGASTVVSSNGIASTTVASIASTAASATASAAISTTISTTTPTTSSTVSSSTTVPPGSVDAPAYSRQVVAIRLYQRLRQTPQIDSRAAVDMASTMLQRKQERADQDTQVDCGALSALHTNRLLDRVAVTLDDTHVLSSLALLRKVHAALIRRFPDALGEVMETRAVELATTEDHRDLHPDRTKPQPRD